MKNANGKTSWTRAIAIVLVLAGGMIWYANSTNGGKRYGPLACPACRLAAPQPEPATAAFLSVWERKAAGAPRSLARMKVSAGDTVIVCNGVGCVPYTKTDSEQYEGGEAIFQSAED